MSAPARQVIKVDNIRAVCVEVVGAKVNLSLLALGINTFSQPISADVSQAIGAALTLAGTEAAKVSA